MYLFFVSPHPLFFAECIFSDKRACFLYAMRCNKKRTSTKKFHQLTASLLHQTIEIRSHSQVRAPSPIRIVREPSPPRTERIIVEEHQERRESRRRGDSDEVVVIEEHSPPRRKKSHRDREREVSRDREVDSGFRTVDPLAYGGVVGGNPRRGSRRGRD